MCWWKQKIQTYDFTDLWPPPPKKRLLFCSLFLTKMLMLALPLHILFCCVVSLQGRAPGGHPIIFKKKKKKEKEKGGKSRRKEGKNKKIKKWPQCTSQMGQNCWVFDGGNPLTPIFLTSTPLQMWQSGLTHRLAPLWKYPAAVLDLLYWYDTF